MIAYSGRADSLWNQVDHQILGHFSDRSPAIDAWGCPIGAKHVEAYLRDGRSRFDVIVREVLASTSYGARVLEVGSAYGATLLALQRLGFRVTSADHPASIVSYGRPIVEAGIRAVAWDLQTEDGTLPEGSFDILICAEVIEHLQISVRSVVGKLARLLASGGSLIVTAPNLRSLSNLVGLLSGRNIIEAFPDRPPIQNGVVVDWRAHPREPVMREMVRAMEESNLRVVRQTGFDKTTALAGFRPLCWALTPKPFKQHLLVRGVRE